MSFKLFISALVLVVLGYGFYAYTNAHRNNLPTMQVPYVVNPVMSGDLSNFIAFSVAPGATISGVNQVSGIVKGAYFFEGVMRVNVLGANQQLLRAGSGKATGTWMTADPVSFTTVVDVTGLPAGPAFIELHNDNPSDMPENDKHILIPIIIQ